MKIERHLPRTWEKIDGLRIMDPDGWRSDGKSFKAPLTRKEWNRRMIRSTCMLKTNFKTFSDSKDVRATSKTVGGQPKI